MTVQAFRLLRKLKKSQMNLNELVYIDYDAMTASTIHESGKPFEKVNLKAYRTSLDSTLRYLFERKYIDYDGDHSVVQTRITPLSGLTRQWRSGSAAGESGIILV